MKAILICGSPRMNGNTEILLRKCQETLEARGIGCELVRLADKTIQPCTACGTCARNKDKACAIKTDDFHGVFGKMLEADIIVLGSPVYFGSATPQLMSLLDRAGYISRFNGNLFHRKLGGPIVVARRAGQNFTYAQLMYWFTIAGMIVAGSTYWNIAFGTKKGDVEQDAEGIETVVHFAENLAWLAGKIAG
ncbi:MAG TPA: flavodoxin family protein [Candidatus Hydrogenedentes bacterium]|nr:flavodoxin family protein [Candidatus Hydrogenedentota bacterium]HOV74183.1 flavodoxin family protein [Candidatus Hydrogenedentota bacterium]HPC15722.1 flavodoxin family protein [Candidatus Hydrogenedentota bacterium]HRT19654.1 flavodoxin family protein [Candidatus Hydrogenedentota bacterium]HRT64428.1 flavodoxin family protein [Candidatus Hydrogenedentota bacterium]